MQDIETIKVGDEIELEPGKKVKVERVNYTPEPSGVFRTKTLVGLTCLDSNNNRVIYVVEFVAAINSLYKNGRRI